MDERATEMRLSALEYLVCKIHLSLILGTAGTADKAEKALAKFAKDAEAQMFPTDDPAFSDLMSAEWGEAIGYLIKIEREMLAAARQGRARK